MLQLSALLDSAPLGDKRLTNRAYSIVASLLQGQTSATDGTQGVGHASPFSQTMGSFRFFDNDRLKLIAVYSNHAPRERYSGAVAEARAFEETVVELSRGGEAQRQGNR